MVGILRPKNRILGTGARSATTRLKTTGVLHAIQTISNAVEQILRQLLHDDGSAFRATGKPVTRYHRSFSYVYLRLSSVYCDYRLTLELWLLNNFRPPKMI